MLDCFVKVGSKFCQILNKLSNIVKLTKFCQIWSHCWNWPNLAETNTLWHRSNWVNIKTLNWNILKCFIVSIWSQMFDDFPVFKLLYLQLNTLFTFFPFCIKCIFVLGAKSETFLFSLISSSSVILLKYSTIVPQMKYLWRFWIPFRHNFAFTKFILDEYAKLCCLNERPCCHRLRIVLKNYHL